MPVTLLSGLPGSGKTAQLVKRILELREKEPGRPIFQMGINGLKEGLAGELTMPQLEKWWEELPPGSIICLDECQEDHLMPKDRGNPAPWVQKITKVRHFGMDFILTTQHPANMSAYVRRLVDNHVHSVMRAKGVRQTYTWMRCIDDPDSRREKKTAEMSFAAVPKETFDLYTSSSLHTMKVKTPRMFYYMGAVAVVGLFLAVFIPYRLHKVTHDVPKVAVDAAPAAASASLRQKDYAEWVKPRVAGIPWTAPMYDSLTVKADPRLYCIAVDDGRCSCMTEQGTHYDVPLATCRSVAANGIYNPFQDSTAHGSGDRSPGSRDEPSPGRRTAASLPVVPAISSVDVALSPGQSGARATAAPYVPPTYAKWDSDPFGSK